MNPCGLCGSPTTRPLCSGCRRISIRPVLLFLAGAVWLCSLAVMFGVTR